MGDAKENSMSIISTEVNMAKHAIQDKLESQIKAAVAKLETLRAEAETVKADIEIKAITELLTKQQEILMKLRDLRKHGRAGANG
jgi:uncharacterized protein YacL (UPF0231 family)